MGKEAINGDGPIGKGENINIVKCLFANEFFSFLAFFLVPSQRSNDIIHKMSRQIVITILQKTGFLFKYPVYSSQRGNANGLSLYNFMKT